MLLFLVLSFLLLKVLSVQREGGERVRVIIFCMSRCIGLSFKRTTSLASSSDHFPQNSCALSPFLFPFQGGTVQRALRQLPDVLQVPSTGCIDDTFFLCPHLIRMSCLVLPPPTHPPTLYHLLKRIFTVKHNFVLIFSPSCFVCAPECLYSN
jgi:hypothetical protein